MQRSIQQIRDSIKSIPGIYDPFDPQKIFAGSISAQEMWPSATLLWPGEEAADTAADEHRAPTETSRITSASTGRELSNGAAELDSMLVIEMPPANETQLAVLSADVDAQLAEIRKEVQKVWFKCLA